MPVMYFACSAHAWLHSTSLTNIQLSERQKSVIWKVFRLRKFLIFSHFFPRVCVLSQRSITLFLGSKKDVYVFVLSWLFFSIENLLLSEKVAFKMRRFFGLCLWVHQTPTYLYFFFTHHQTQKSEQRPYSHFTKVRKTSTFSRDLNLSLERNKIKIKLKKIRRIFENVLTQTWCNYCTTAAHHVSGIIQYVYGLTSLQLGNPHRLNSFQRFYKQNWFKKFVFNWNVADGLKNGSNNCWFADQFTSSAFVIQFLCLLHNISVSLLFSRISI